MKHYVLSFLIASIFSCSSVSAQYLEDVEFLNSTPAFLLGLVPDIPAEYPVDYYKITYNTVDVQGEPTIASGAVAIPVTEECNNFPMAVYCHGTVLRQNDVPSQDNFEGIITKVFASTGFISIAPDYLGLGENPGIHPYVHDESQATATLDLIKATREFLEGQPVSDNGEVFITGYSQGGHAAMGALKHAEENGQTEELGIVAGAPCSGPYDISGSQAETLLSEEPYETPGYAIYVLISYNFAYGNLFNELSDIVEQPYADDVAPYFDGAQDEFDMGTVNDILPNIVSDFLVDSLLDNFENNLNHPLRQALEDNNNFDWTPQVPIRMFYCDNDEQVNFQNSINAEATMNDNGAEDVEAVLSLAGGNHGTCVIPALSDAYEFFTSLATPCDLIMDVEELAMGELNVYPNPADQFTIIETEYPGGRIQLFDLSGRMVMQQTATSTNTRMDISSLAPGAYVMTLEEDNRISRSTIVVN
ncbi:MAG: T9SS type A sorting domain-containing protein [Cryomorphaceae bacterium]|nr:T9SS type A sorting domain-containing protein [Flavobacteriales bacterium]